MTKWGWVAYPNKDWSDLDPIANTAADLGLLSKPDLGHSATQNRSTWMQAIDIGPQTSPASTYSRPARADSSDKAGTFSPHFADQVPSFYGFVYKPMDPTGP